MVKLYFNGTDSTGSEQLWTTDGTAAGTTELTAGAGAKFGLTPIGITIYGPQQVLFDGRDATGNEGLWSFNPADDSVTELTVAGAATPNATTRFGFAPFSFTVYHDLVYFGGESSGAAPDQLWVTDGTSNGTHVVGPITGLSGTSGAPADLTVFQGKLLFDASGKLFSSDGTAAGTQQVAVPAAYSGGLYPRSLTAFGTQLLFTGEDAAGTYQLFSYDGTAVTELTAGAGGYRLGVYGLAPSNIAVLGNIALFEGTNAAGQEGLWRTDGTVQGTQEITGIAGAPAGGLAPTDLTTVGTHVLFQAAGPGNELNLWSTDGFAANTFQIPIADTYPGKGVAPGNIIAIGSSAALFAGTDSAPVRGLWTTSGSGVTTVEITPITGAGSDGLNPQDFVVACFASGTRICTDRGEVAVEALRVGDALPTLRGGGLRPVRWIGHRDLRCSRHSRPAELWPVRIRAGAIAPGVPHRDLLLSPEHAIYLRGVLVPVRCLLDGGSIEQIPCDAVTYWHVELDAHDIILAEGLPTESYLDTGNRHAFANGGPAIELRPDFASIAWQAGACASQLRHGPLLDAIRRDLAARSRLQSGPTSPCQLPPGQAVTERRMAARPSPAA